MHLESKMVLSLWLKVATKKITEEKLLHTAVKVSIKILEMWEQWSERIIRQKKKKNKKKTKTEYNA